MKINVLLQIFILSLPLSPPLNIITMIIIHSSSHSSLRSSLSTDNRIIDLRLQVFSR